MACWLPYLFSISWSQWVVLKWTFKIRKNMSSKASFLIKIVNWISWNKQTNKNSHTRIPPCSKEQDGARFSEVTPAKWDVKHLLADWNTVNLMRHVMLIKRTRSLHLLWSSFSYPLYIYILIKRMFGADDPYLYSFYLDKPSWPVLFYPLNI